MAIYVVADIVADAHKGTVQHLVWHIAGAMVSTSAEVH